jgi:hypothetical protein
MSLILKKRVQQIMNLALFARRERLYFFQNPSTVALFIDCFHSLVVPRPLLRRIPARQFGMKAPCDACCATRFLPPLQQSKQACAAVSLDLPDLLSSLHLAAILRKAAVATGKCW